MVSGELDAGWTSAAACLRLKPATENPELLPTSSSDKSRVSRFIAQVQECLL